MPKPKGKREPRTPMLTNELPATYAEAEEREIIAKLEQWYPRFAEELTSEAAHEAVRDDILRQLERGDNASLHVAYIVAMADAEHPPADHALRIFIHAAIDAKRFDNLPLQVQGYAERALLRPPLPIGYPSNRSQVVNDYTRDVAIRFLLDRIVARWPQVPRHYGSQTRHSACWLLATVFTRHGIILKEQQVRRIDKGRQTQGRRLAEFLIADLPFE